MNELETMLPAKELPNLTNIKYPILVQPIITGESILYLPKQGLFVNKKYVNELHEVNLKLSSLFKVSSFMFEGKWDGRKLYIYDTMPIKSWLKRDYPTPYETRLKDLRDWVNSYISDYYRIIDIPTDLASNPKEVKDLYKKYLSEGKKGVILKSTEGTYKWDQLQLEDEIMFQLTKVENNE